MLWVFRYPSFAPESGPHRVGAIQTRIAGSVACQVHYPASTKATTDAAANKNPHETFYPYFRPKAVLGMADYSRTHPALLQFLSRRSHPCLMNAEPRQLHHGGPTRTTTTANENKFPLVLFSHGLGGSMELYTQLCQQIASYGFVVVAMEHEDGSAAYAETTMGEPIAYRRPDDTPYSRQKVLTFRRPFLQQRLDETMTVINTIRNHRQQQQQQPDTTTTNTTIMRPGDLSEILDIADTDGGISLIGHSFGGASMILTAQHSLDQQQPPQEESTPSAQITSLCLLDPWAFSLEDEVLNRGIPQDKIPTLCILSESWLTNPETKFVHQLLNRCLLLPQSSSSAVGPPSYYAPRTVHASVADSVSWLPGWIGRKLHLRGKRERRFETIPAVARACVHHIIQQQQQQHSTTRTTTTTVAATNDDDGGGDDDEALLSNSTSRRSKTTTGNGSSSFLHEYKFQS